MVAVQDTITGFLLAGVGNVDLRKKSNFLVVNESTHEGFTCSSLPCAPEICLGQLKHQPKSTGTLCHAETSVKRIEDAFKEYTNRDDVAIVLINQYIANMIRHLIANYTAVRDLY